jgi:hypothetical protein
MRGRRSLRSRRGFAGEMRGGREGNRVLIRLQLQSDEYNNMITVTRFQASPSSLTMQVRKRDATERVAKVLEI